MVVLYHKKFRNINQRTLKIVRTIIKKGLFKSHNTLEYKKGLILELHKNLCEIYDLKVNKINFIIQSENICSYNHLNKVITLNNTSLINYLHEFRHYFECEKNGFTTEDTARGWSISVYYMATPILCKNAIERGLIIHQNTLGGSD